MKKMKIEKMKMKIDELEEDDIDDIINYSNGKKIFFIICSIK